MFNLFILLRLENALAKTFLKFPLILVCSNCLIMISVNGIFTGQTTSQLAQNVVFLVIILAISPLFLFFNVIKSTGEYCPVTLKTGQTSLQRPNQCNRETLYTNYFLKSKRLHYHITKDKFLPVRFYNWEFLNQNFIFTNFSKGV